MVSCDYMAPEASIRNYVLPAIIMADGGVQREIPVDIFLGERKTPRRQQRRPVITKPNIY